ncbi:MAG: membrane integrity-associated transporter subunit PqiC [Candidatus Thiodiazotropha sp. (ex Gloverina cf. vestifex)]|nr:membrane integrity-associated transporter subunit PqiC [Candidatus Thiodiazotropha sp. (ex Gloverina cf. vestifex)]
MSSTKQLGVFALFWCLLLTACATSEPIPEDHFYRLLSPSNPTLLEKPIIDGVLKVESIKSFGIYRERAILFSRSDSPETLKQHHYHHSPTRLIRDQLVDYLRKRTIAETVAGAQIGMKSDIRLHLELKHFERVLHPSGSVSVKVRLDAMIAGKSNRPLKIASYLQEPMAENSSIAASVAAINLALVEIYRKLVEEMRHL